MILFAWKYIEKIHLFKLLFEKADKISHGLLNRMRLAISAYTNSWKILLGYTAASVFFVHLIQMPVLVCICFGLGMEISVSFLLGGVILAVTFTPIVYYSIRTLVIHYRTRSAMRKAAGNTKKQGK